MNTIQRKTPEFPGFFRVHNERRTSSDKQALGLPRDVWGENAVTTTATPDSSPSAALIDVRALAALLDCSTRHVFRLADAGRLPAPLRLGCLVRWRRAEVEQWIADGCPATRRAAP
jgi:excisionase family DNA binding protein